ncbi:hypothetical protein BCEN4_40010 [Burkholderia cenocepacia]|nr:hypothetical protein BCEN4_40010 [Burkholderia cenocepacia]
MSNSPSLRNAASRLKPTFVTSTCAAYLPVSVTRGSQFISYPRIKNVFCIGSTLF